MIRDADEDGSTRVIPEFMTTYVISSRLCTIFNRKRIQRELELELDTR